MKKIIFAIFMLLMLTTVSYAETRSSQASAKTREEACSGAKTRGMRALYFENPKLKITEYKDCECTENEEENMRWVCTVEFEIEPVEE